MNNHAEHCMLSFIFQYKAEPQDISILLQGNKLSKVLNKNNNKKQNKQTKKPEQLSSQNN